MLVERLLSAGLGIHQLLQFFAGLERCNSFGRNLHTRARLRVPPDTRLPLVRVEGSKAPDFDLIPSTQSANDTVKNSLDNTPQPA